MTKDTLKISQPILVLVNKNYTQIGDVAFECGVDNVRHQFHSSKLVEPRTTNASYWVEWLDRKEYILLSDKEYKQIKEYKDWNLEKVIKFLAYYATV